MADVAPDYLTSRRQPLLCWDVGCRRLGDHTATRRDSDRLAFVACFEHAHFWADAYMVRLAQWRWLFERVGEVSCGKVSR